MLHQCGIPAVQKTLRQPRQQIHPAVRFPKQQSTTIRTDGPAAELCHHLPAEMGGKVKPRLVTLCRSRGRYFSWLQHVVANMFMPQKTASGYTLCELSGLGQRCRLSLPVRLQGVLHGPAAERQECGEIIDRHRPRRGG